MNNENEYYNIEETDFEITELVCKKGNFTNSEGQTFPYRSFNIKIKINDYPMEFKFKLDKVFNEYVEDALKKGE